MSKRMNRATPSAPRSWRPWLATLGLAAVVGCGEGVISDLGGGSGETPGLDGGQGGKPGGPTTTGGAGSGVNGGGTSGTTPAAPDTPLRRLSSFEYNNIVRDLLGVTSRPANAFVDQDREGVFDNDVSFLGVSEQLTEQYLEAAEKMAEEATQPDRLGTLLACDAASASDDCVRTALSGLATRAYRRPLTGSEVDDLMSTYAFGKADGVVVGLRVAIARMLCSPYFLYWDERGAASATPDAQGQVKLAPHEVAARMSRLLVASIPDAELSAAAAGGQLETTAQRLAQARRLLRGADGKPTTAAAAAVDHFHAQWLDLQLLDVLAKNVAGFDPSMGPAMRAETDAFLREIVWGKHDAREMLTANYSFVDSKVAGLYGLSGVSSSEPTKVSLDPTQRAGLLTQPGILAMTSTDRSSPIHRAAFILGRIACAPPGAPPPDAPKEVPAETPGGTAREKFEALTQPVKCAGCHGQLNGLGFTFDQYDAIGRYRTVDDDNKPLNTTGELVGTDVDGPVKNALEAVAHLSESEEVRACLVQQWFRYASGRFEGSADQAALGRIRDRFEGSGNLVEEILLAVVADDQFTLRLAPKP